MKSVKTFEMSKKRNGNFEKNIFKLGKFKEKRQRENLLGKGEIDNISSITIIGFTKWTSP